MLSDPRDSEEDLEVELDCEDEDGEKLLISPGQNKYKRDNLAPIFAGICQPKPDYILYPNFIGAMDRNEGIIRWSPSPAGEEFMTINLSYRLIQLYAATGHAKPGHFEYSKLTKHNEWSHLNTYDWSPVNRGLVAIGTSHGNVELLRVDDDSNASISLPLKLQRSCQTVAFNITGLLAVGLDRVRNDACLQIWDVNQRLADWDSKQPGFNVVSPNPEPKKKLEASVSITSVRFFEDQPQTLVAGVKNQSVRVLDLRDPNSVVINFQTRCNNNIAIDYTDSNYFASSSLDQPGFVVWDRRVSTRSGASAMYLESVDQEEIPWGAALKIDRAIQVEKNISVKQLRFSRECRGALGVLSTAGQLQIFQTKKEYIEPSPENDIEGTPELLEVQKSYDLEYPYFDPDHKRRLEDRIVSFDWLNIGTTDLEARVVALRANGSFEILQMPSATAGQLSQFIPWRPPHHIGEPYMTLMKFSDSVEQEKNLGPLYATAAKSQVPIFGPNGYNNPKTAAALNAAIKKAIHSIDDPVVDLRAPDDPKYPNLVNELSNLHIGDKVAKGKEIAVDTPEPKRVYSSRELHDKSHYTIISAAPHPKEEREHLDNVMLKRAIDGYLFNCKENKAIIADDPWLQDTWDWVQGAEEAAADDGMVSGPLDLSYLGVYTLWNNLLGEKAESRLIDSTIIPDTSQWERIIANINKRAGRPDFEGVQTSKPQHRQLCLAIAGMVKSSAEFDEDLEGLIEQGKHTAAAAYALFDGLSRLAVEILKDAGSDLIFVAMALEMKFKSKVPLELDPAEWNKALGKHPDMAYDPYLRAIYSFITTGDWIAIADETSLPLRARVGVALRNFDDDKLTTWLEQQMEEATVHGDIEGIVLAGISDNMADIFAKYIEKFNDYQTPILILSFCYPRYITDIRCAAWRKAYQALLQRHKKFILRVKFEQQSTIKSRNRDGVPVIKPPPRQITIRCLKCDSHAANDLANTAGGQTTAGSSTVAPDIRNPLAATGINAGLCCPRCGSHLGRCAVCMEIVGVPRSDRPELSNDPQIRRMAHFPSFCLKCKHVMHMDHAVAWFSRHVECAVPECKCQCNASSYRQGNSN